MFEAFVISKSSLLIILNAAGLYIINKKIRIIQILRMFNLKSGRIFCASGLQYFNL